MQLTDSADTGGDEDDSEGEDVEELELGEPETELVCSSPGGGGGTDASGEDMEEADDEEHELGSVEASVPAVIIARKYSYICA